MKLNPGLLSIATFTFILTLYLREATAAIYSEPHQNSATEHRNSKVLVPKVSLTQKGYIQFLRYVVDVPELTEYTFCIWVRSNNLTYSHPLLSYSKHEEKRLIRVWISPAGSHINLELLKVPVFRIPVHFIENEWTHVCQSWSSNHAAWSLYLNGKLKASGNALNLKNAVIEHGGDLVVGQEYTDFDKGLDDGIEGDISGFNFVLASTYPGVNINKHPVKPYFAPNSLFKREIKAQKTVFDDPFFANDKHFRTIMNTSPEKSHTRRQIWDESLEFFSNQKRLPPLPLEDEADHSKLQSKVIYEPQQFPERAAVNKGLPLRDYIYKPLGLLLVELSMNCGYLRGAPLSGKGVLVSWTKTEVRVFGGAILKSVPPFCVK